MSEPLVSIGLPAYKGKYLREMLLSLKDQTYTNFEVLIHDDASPDNILKIVSETCCDDLRFSYARNENNTSPNFVRNWNQTLSRARGEYFVLASDDDIYEPTFLEELVSLAESNPSCNLFCSPVRAFYPDGRIEEYSPPEIKETQISLTYKLLVTNELFTVVPNYLVRTRALKEIGGFLDLPAAWSSDWWTWCRLAKNSVISADTYLFRWRTSGENISSVESDYWIDQKILALKKGIYYWQKLIGEMVATTDEDAKLLIAIRGEFSSDKMYYGIESLILQTRFFKFIYWILRQVLERECSLNHLCWLIYRRIRFNISKIP